MAVVEITDDMEAQREYRDISALKRMWQNASDAQGQARELAFRDRDWKDNYADSQWTTQEKQELKKRGQPPITVPDIKRHVNFLLGWEQRTRTDPRAFPRTPESQPQADIVSNVLDYVENNTRLDKTASACFSNLAVEGIEAAEVIYDNADGKIDVVRIAYEKFFYDPRSREHDFSDARYLGYIDWYDKDEAAELFPGADEVILDTLSESEDQGFEDKPILWGDPTRQRVRIAYVYYKHGDGGWCYSVFTGSGILDQGDSAYQDEDGKSACPIVAQSCYVDRDNNRFGIVRDMISPQREKNWRRSLALYNMKSQRIWAVDGAFQDPAAARAEAAKSDGFLECNLPLGEGWGFIDNGQETAANFALLQQADADMDRQGPNRALAGAGNRATSGRDRALQQNAGLTEENTLFDQHMDWKLRIYRAMWARAKQFWTDQKYIRISKNPQAMEFVTINEPVIQQDEFGNQYVVGVENQLARIDVDITIEAVQDAATLQHEQFEIFTNALPVLVGAPPVYTDILFDMMPNLPNKTELRTRIQEARQAQEQQAMQAQQVQLQMAQIEAEGKINKAAKDKADAIKTTVETEGEQIENEARRQSITGMIDPNINFGF